MIIECELLNHGRPIFLNSIWDHSPADPLVVRVEFEGARSVWGFSLELLMEAFTAPDEGLHGSGDSLFEVGKDFTYIHLSNGPKAASLRFSTADIRSFLDQVDTPDSDEVIASKLDEFLETL